MTNQLVITDDGSHSVISEEFNEQYHSRHGAIQESKHVFINAGLLQKINLQKEIFILEIGFGTGLNALLSCIESENHQQKISYTAIEKFPLKKEVFIKFNFCDFLENKNSINYFDKILNCNWNISEIISPFFTLKKVLQNIEDCDFPKKFDVIYFDAFAPTAQPELWTEVIFESMYNALKKDGVLVTYCAKGEVKRTLKKTGFKVESLPGPAGKREMTRAVKQPEQV